MGEVSSMESGSLVDSDIASNAKADTEDVLVPAQSQEEQKVEDVVAKEPESEAQTTVVVETSPEATEDESPKSKQPKQKAKKKKEPSKPAAPPPAAAALFLGASPKKDDVSSKGSKGSKTGRKSGTIEKDVKKQSEVSATQIEGSLGTSADDIPEVVAGEDQVGNEAGSSISSITRGQAFENVDEKVDHQDTTHEDKQDDVEKEKKQ